MLIPGFTQVHVASVHLEIDFKSAAGFHLAAVSGRALLAENACWLLSTADLCYGDLILASENCVGNFGCWDAFLFYW